MQTIQFWKIAATTGGAGLTASAVWLNAEHVASSEGWNSPLVFAGVIVTLCAASAPPFAERATKTGQPFKAIMLWVFFSLVVGFSLSASIARSSGYAAGKTAGVEQANETARLAHEAYQAAKDAQKAECATGHGSRCRIAEQTVVEARKSIARLAPVQSIDPGAERLAAVLGIEESTVRLYVPLFLPLGLEIGGFIFLALGLAPAPCNEFAIEPVAIPVQADAVPLQATAKPSPAVAKLVQEAIKPAPIGTRTYYLARLDREFPAIAKRVHAGELSVFRGCIEAGLRKAPAKHAKWTQVEGYANPPSISV